MNKLGEMSRENKKFFRAEKPFAAIIREWRVRRGEDPLSRGEI